MERAALKRPLRRGWTTGTCAAAASRAAYQALLTGVFPDPVEVLLPGGSRPCFALAVSEFAWERRTRRHHQGRWGRPRCDAWRAGPGDRPPGRTGHRRHLLRRRRRRHGDPSRSATAARGARDQPGAARDDPNGDCRGRPPLWRKR